MKYNNFFRKHRNIIFLIIIFTTIFSIRLYYDFTKLKPIPIPVLKHNIKKDTLITKNNITTKLFYKINLTQDIIRDENVLINQYANTTIIAGQPISKQQITSRKNKFRYLEQLDKNIRVITLESNIHHSDIKVGDRLEITVTVDKHSNGELEPLLFVISSNAKVVNIIFSNATSANDYITNSKSPSGRESVPKTLMIAVTKEEADMFDKYSILGKVNIRLLPPSAFERSIENEEDSSSSL